MAAFNYGWIYKRFNRTYPVATPNRTGADTDQEPDDDMSSIADPKWLYVGTQAPGYVRDVDRPDRTRDFQERERDFNQYEEREQERPDEYPFQNFNYGP